MRFAVLCVAAALLRGREQFECRINHEEQLERAVREGAEQRGGHAG